MAPSRNGSEAPAPAAPDAGSPDYPNRRRTDRQTGTLVLIGGACDPQGDALGSFLDRCNAREGGKVVGITTASTDPAGSAREWMGAFAAAGAHNVEIPVIDRRDRAQDHRIAEMIRGADGIFLGGGDQVHLVA
ncbi:MAG TPA: Type 1 glutamine amidotransferase-like domain-containing protein, partial [Longimicrobiaceae bacterium]|nr:Type 1 glutamine amidotransferase-like domain-containing protein [Longimicrobiaceae bacterium]